MKVICAATVAPFKCAEGEELIWLRNAEVMQEVANVDGHELAWFLAAETTGPAADALDPVIAAVEALSGEVWRYSVGRGIDEVTTSNRQLNVDIGRNIVNRYAVETGCDRLLMMDTDILFPPETIPALLEIGEHPTVGLHVPEYCLTGPAVEHPTIDDLREHWTTAGCLMMTWRVAERICWRRDVTHGWTDDPAFQHDVAEIFGQMTWVRHDVAARHVPPLVAIEQRGYDRTVRET